MSIRGTTGSILQTSEFNVRAGSSLGISASSAADNRVGDNTPIHLRGGNLFYSELSGGSGSTRTETTGAVDGAGFSTINASSGQFIGVRLHLGSLARSERGTFLFRGDNLGNTPANGVGSIFINQAPTGLVGGGGTGAKTSILPYAIGDTAIAGSGNTFVTYSAATGVRPLNRTTEYRTTLASAAVDENVRLTANESLNTARTVNALLLDGGGVNGTGALTIASGALLYRSGAGISNPLAFWAVEANIFNSTDLVLNGVISGTNGLTKSGAGKLTLGAANTFTGPLTINAGTIVFAAGDRLGADATAFVINGHGAGLNYNGFSSLDLGRPIETRTGLAKIDVSGGGDLNIMSPIAGAGGLQLTSSNNRAITLSSGSTYTGITHLGTGRVVIANDSAFGAGGALHVDGGTIRLSGDWNSEREISVRSGTLDTAGFDAIWSGTLNGFGGLSSFTKRGAGELRIVEPSAFRISTEVEGGVLTLAEDGEIAADVSVSGGAELRLDHGSSIKGSKLADTSKVYLRGGKLVLIGNATTAITEKVQLLEPSGSGRSDHTLDLITPGACGFAVARAGGDHSRRRASHQGLELGRQGARHSR